MGNGGASGDKHARAVDAAEAVSSVTATVLQQREQLQSKSDKVASLEQELARMVAELATLRDTAASDFASDI
jgi:hypothetical protein